mgnify:CR=1 FL=1
MGGVHSVNTWMWQLRLWIPLRADRRQAADILAFSKITNSNCDLLIGDIRASFGVYQAPPPVGPVESVQNGVQVGPLPFSNGQGISGH